MFVEGIRHEYEKGDIFCLFIILKRFKFSKIGFATLNFTLKTNAFKLVMKVIG